MYIRGRDMFFAISTVICLVDWLLCYAFQWYSVFRVSRLLRPVLLIRCVSRALCQLCTLTHRVWSLARKRRFAGWRR